MALSAGTLPRAARWGLVAASALSLLMAGVAAGRRLSDAAASSRLPVLGEVPAFSLVDQAGRPVTSQTLRGQVWIADFIFTRCAGQCPMMSEQMAGLAQSLGRLPVQCVSFSVDPAYDRPEVLSAYAARYHADPARWRLLTGEPEAIRRLCQDGFKLSMADGGSPQEPVVHSRRFVLVDRQGRIRGYFDAGEASEMAALRRAAQGLAEERE